MPSIDETLGALEIGIILSIFLFGVFVVQLFLYSHQNNNDRRWLRSLVSQLLILETTHTFCICILLYNITVTRYGIVSTISDAPFTLDFSGILSAWIGAVIQAFFAYRVRVISGRLLIPIISWSLSVLRMGFGVMIGVTAFRSGTLLRFIGQWHWLITTEFTISAVIDVLNTTSICFYLLRRRSQFHSSSKFVDRIILFSIGDHLASPLPHTLTRF
ncbi:hypothetical protein JB92DRAFT_3227748 [Gautieria morchelliformis]|nr:hypothetical protein JB92DRAFT_3227748 [Gautieria morchelliformis]